MIQCGSFDEHIRISQGGEQISDSTHTQKSPIFQIRSQDALLPNESRVYKNQVHVRSKFAFEEAVFLKKKRTHPTNALQRNASIVSQPLSVRTVMYRQSKKWCSVKSNSCDPTNSHSRPPRLR
jgi:hypothetical protein